jgi:hypothetical protein
LSDLPWIVVIRRLITRTCGRHTKRITAQFDSKQILPHTAASQEALPDSPADDAGCIDSICLPQQAQVSRVSFEAQYQAFVRFAVGNGAALEAIALN